MNHSGTFPPACFATYRQTHKFTEFFWSKRFILGLSSCLMRHKTNYIFAFYVQCDHSCCISFLLSLQKLSDYSRMKINSYSNMKHAWKLLLPSGVAEQFAIAEAKLRAWASLDDDDEEDSNDEDLHSNEQTHTFCYQRSGDHTCVHIGHFMSSSMICDPWQKALSSIHPSTHPIPSLHPSPGGLTVCSSLRHPNIQSYHRSAMPVWRGQQWDTTLWQLLGLE